MYFKSINLYLKYQASRSDKKTKILCFLSYVIHKERELEEDLASSKAKVIPIKLRYNLFSWEAGLLPLTPVSVGVETRKYFFQQRLLV